MKKTITITLLAICLLVPTFAAFAQKRPKITEPSSSSRRSAASVDYIKEQVRKELVTLPYYGVYDYLEAEVTSEGTVVLRGEALRPTTADDAGRRVKKIEGVEKVVNHIEVLPLSPNDDRIRQRAYRVLFGGNSPLFRYGLAPVPSIHIIVKGGRITLKGLVDNKTDSDIAFIRTNGIDGVFQVTNQLVVLKKSKKK